MSVDKDGVIAGKSLTLTAAGGGQVTFPDGTTQASAGATASDWLFSADAAAPTTTDTYMPPGHYNGTLGVNVFEIPCPRALQIQAAYVKAQVGSVGGTTSFTVCKNNVATGIGFTIAAGVTTGNQAGTVDCAAGDLIQIRVKGGLGISAAMQRLVVSIKVRG